MAGEAAAAGNGEPGRPHAPHAVEIGDEIGVVEEGDLARIAGWARESGVRWGLSADQRAPYKLERVEANTWQWGWDRVLLGVAMAEEDQRLLGGVLPLDDVGSGDIDLAGRFAEYL